MSMSIIVIVVLSLLVWAFFYIKNLPLKTEETAVVVLFFAIIVTLAKIIRKKWRDKNDKLP